MHYKIFTERTYNPIKHMRREMTPIIYKLLYSSILLTTMVSIITGVWGIYGNDSITGLLYKAVAKLFFIITAFLAAGLGVIKLLT